jgi:hypothetical protein
VAPDAFRRALAVAVALLAAATAVPATAPAARVRDVRLPGHGVRRLAETAWWGGVYTSAAGERVAIHLAVAYPRDDDVAQQWADFLGSLVHGSELSLTSLYLAPPDEVRMLCAAEADGCYDGSRIVAVGDSSAGIAPTSVVAHEYGHHIAEHRLNPPWRAIDWGPKRWSSAVGVCARAAAGTAFPGDEGLHYAFNPGEAFAESYRVLNETRAALPLAWTIVDGSFAPTPQLLQAVEQDVVHPWTGPTTQTVRGSFRGRAPSWRLPLATPLDGDLDVVLRVPPSTAASLVLVGSDGAVLARGLLAPDGRETLHFTICGQRSLVVVVKREVGHGRAFTLSVTQP